MQDIKRYWEIKPPVIDNGLNESNWISQTRKNRFEYIPYLYDWADFGSYENKNVLEIGCGAGIDSVEFAMKGANVTSVDITDTAIKLTEKRFKHYKLKGNVQKYNGKGLSFKDNSFDLVYSQGVLHHTPHMEDLISEAHRVLKPDGLFKIMIYNRDSLIYNYSIMYLRRHCKKLYHLSRDQVLSMYSEFRENCPYTRAFSKEELEIILSRYFRENIVRRDYLVYDTLNRRKRKPKNNTIRFTKTAMTDVNNILESYNADLLIHDVGLGYMKKYGWHLLAKAVK